MYCRIVKLEVMLENNWRGELAARRFYCGRLDSASVHYDQQPMVSRRDATNGVGRLNEVKEAHTGSPTATAERAALRVHGSFPRLVRHFSIGEARRNLAGLVPAQARC